jgi:hypothetical protein
MEGSSEMRLPVEDTITESEADRLEPNLSKQIIFF